MTKSILPRRKYDSTRRQAQAKQTRRQILEAARQLFTERGYTGATIEAIAATAEVAPETIYAVFKNKKKILTSLLNLSTATDAEENLPILQRARPQAVSREHDQHRQLQMFAQVVADNLEGVAYLSEIMLVAAKTEPDIDKLLQYLLKQRWQHMAIAVRQVTFNGPLRENMDETDATDIVGTLTSPEVFLLLTRERGWSKEKYREWLAKSLIRMLLP